MGPPSYTRSVVDRNVVMRGMIVIIKCFRISVKRRSDSFWHRVYLSERTKQTDCHSNGLSNENLHANAICRRVTVFITSTKTTADALHEDIRESLRVSRVPLPEWRTILGLGGGAIWMNSAYFAGKIPRPVLSPSSILPPPSLHCAFISARKNAGQVLKKKMLFNF